MTRTADYTISGFLYQFNKTLFEILNSLDDEEIIIEGIVEDIEVTNPIITKAIQCKYHESQTSFNLSAIYKPILQMMNHYHDNNIRDIQYILFAHFPNEVSGTIKQLSKTDIELILNTTNQKLARYAIKLIGNVDIDEFLSRFRFEFGPPMDCLISDIGKSFETSGLQIGDIDTLFYPNAIQTIAELSSKHEVIDRKITKSDLLEKLINIRTTAISRWTRELKTFDQLIKQRRKQLSINLKKNSRIRYFYIDSSYLDEFNDSIITFISEYLDKYHFKLLHDKPPLFYLQCSVQAFEEIRIRLHKKGIKFNDGFVTGTFFDKKKLFMEPIRAKVGSNINDEFSIRILRCYDNSQLLNEIKCHDFFLFTDSDVDFIDYQDINTEKIGLKKIIEIKYVLGMSDSYE